MTEEEKYELLWTTGRIKNSQTAIPLSEYLYDTTSYKNYLDIGCGNGITTYKLRERGRNVIGCDITLAGLLKEKEGFYRAYVENLPFKNNEFECSYSTDLLEHLPEENVEKAISEILRVTDIFSFHCIATFPDSRSGIKTHLTVKPIEWWRDKFNQLNIKKIKLEIVDRKDFLK